jgi:hypothetical protein
MNVIHCQGAVVGLIGLLGILADFRDILIIVESRLITWMGVQKQKDIIHGKAGLVDNR